MKIITATVKSSGRTVNIYIEEKEKPQFFYVVRRFDGGCMVVGGPYALNDPRFSLNPAKESGNESSGRVFDTIGKNR